MKLFTYTILTIGLAFLCSACHKEGKQLTELEKKTIIDSAKTVVKKVFDLSNRLEYKKALLYYSGDNDTRYIDNGSIYPSFDAMKKEYELVGPSMELVENKIQKWDAVFLGNEAVSFTLPIRLKLKVKGLPSYEGQYIWSGIVQKRKGKWLIIQSHASWLNYAEVIAALTPKSNK